MFWDLFPQKITCGPYNATLKVNQACLDVVSQVSVPLTFYKKNVECFECDFRPEGVPVLPEDTTSYIIDTKFGFESYFYDGQNKFCNISNHFQDFGIYSLNVSEGGCSNIKVLKEPEKFWVDCGILICTYLGFFSLYCLLKYLYKHGHQYISSSSVPLRELAVDLGNPNDRSDRNFKQRRQSRIHSIDAFRGLAIFLMIFVNYNGGDFAVFKHTPWNGLSVADLVFPWFVWIMGASIVLSQRSNLRTSSTRKRIFCHILRRSVLLISLGVILNSGKRDRGYLRVSGVLQRLGVTYFIVACIELIIAKPQRNDEFGPWYTCRDLLDSWMQWLFASAVTAVYLLLTFLLPVPGCPTGYLGPGGLSQHSLHKNCTGGAAGYIDRLVLTEKHMYHRGSFVEIYKPPVAFDPEGLLGTLTSVLCAFLGVHAARVILSFENPYSRMRKWLLMAILFGIVAGLLCNWSQNDGVIPVNKNLWSLSYVLLCSSLAFVIFTVFYYLIDFKKIWSGSPFFYAGMNSIILYVGHCLLKSQLPWRWVPYTGSHFELLLMDFTAASIWLLISYVLFRHKVFLTL